MSTEPSPSPDEASRLPDTGESDLPEWEPLSPEILEDEAIRGDFVLRWAVVGLAVLWACTEIGDARTLVHVRTGEWIVQRGWPTGTDPFSITAAYRPWINLPWLFDIAVAGIWQAGPVALSLLQAILGGLAFWLLGQCVRPGIRTWWSSVCGVLAVLAAYPHFELRPELMSLVWLAAMLAILIGSEAPEQRSRLWWLPAILWCWAQTDARAWIGVVLLGLTVIAGKSGVATSHSLRTPLLVAMGVTLLHPHLWETWLAPWRQYVVEYPALRDSYPRPSIMDRAWFPVWSPGLGSPVNLRTVAGLFLLLSAAIALWLNRSQARRSHWLWFAATNAMGLATLHEAPLAALVNAALASVHGQEWYKRRFGQVYSLAPAEIAFSRGGRAVTVLAMLLLAGMAISGRIDTPDGHRTGIGLSRALALELDSLRQLQGATYDDRGFHFTLRQGDALIAAGRKSFVDHRVGLFVGSGPQDLLVQHRLARRALRPSLPPPLTADETHAVRDLFAAHRISHVLPRLNSSLADPDYRTLVDLLASPEWTLTDLLPAVAVFHPRTNSATDWDQFLAAHELKVLDRAFRESLTTETIPINVVLPPGWSEWLLNVERQAVSAGTLEASHWLRLSAAAQNAPLPFHLSCATLAVRAAWQGVRATPRVPQAYHTLGEAYRALGQFEALSLGDQQANWSSGVRFRESVAALRQAQILQPDNPRIAADLFETWRSARKNDAAYVALTQMLTLLPLRANATEQERTQRQTLEKQQRELAGAIADVQLRSETALSQQQHRLEVALGAYQAGCVQFAVKLLTDDAVLLEQQLQARLWLTLWLQDLGETEAMLESAERLQAVAPRGEGGPWQDVLATAALIRNDPAAASAAWQAEADAARSQQLQALLATAPLVANGEVWLGDLQYPVAHLSSWEASLGRSAQQATSATLHTALSQLEQGDHVAAAKSLERILQSSRESPLRLLVQAYWFCLQGEVLDAQPPASDQIPMPESVIAPEP